MNGVALQFESGHPIETEVGSHAICLRLELEFRTGNYFDLVSDGRDAPLGDADALPAGFTHVFFITAGV